MGSEMCIRDSCYIQSSDHARVPAVSHSPILLHWSIQRGGAIRPCSPWKLYAVSPKDPQIKCKHSRLCYLLKVESSRSGNAVCRLQRSPNRLVAKASPRTPLGELTAVCITPHRKCDDLEWNLKMSLNIIHIFMSNISEMGLYTCAHSC